jgi:hypothetical protein
MILRKDPRAILAPRKAHPPAWRNELSKWARSAPFPSVISDQLGEQLCNAKCRRISSRPPYPYRKAPVCGLLRDGLNRNLGRSRVPDKWAPISRMGRQFRM